jgi:hypothetical protein
LLIHDNLDSMASGGIGKKYASNNIRVIAIVAKNIMY